MHGSSLPRNLFLSSLSPSDHRLLEPYISHVELHPGSYLHRKGRTIEHIFFPHTGLIMLAGSLENCTMRDIAVVGREAIIGGFAALAGAPAISDAQVHMGGSAARMPVDAFMAALELSSEIRRLAARCEIATVAQAQQSALCNAAHSVEARICRWLLEIADRCDGERLPLTQSELASMLGVRRTTITLVAGKLQMQGAIKCGRGHVHIADRAMLEQGSCECYAQVKSYASRLFAEAEDLGPAARQPFAANAAVAG